MCRYQTVVFKSSHCNIHTSDCQGSDRHIQAGHNKTTNSYSQISDCQSSYLHVLMSDRRVQMSVRHVQTSDRHGQMSAYNVQTSDGHKH